jgi:hypothetical protein
MYKLADGTTVVFNMVNDIDRVDFFIQLLSFTIQSEMPI